MIAQNMTIERDNDNLSHDLSTTETFTLVRQINRIDESISGCINEDFKQKNYQTTIMITKPGSGCDFTVTEDEDDPYVWSIQYADQTTFYCEVTIGIVWYS